jgi:hypothetical protein
MKRLARRLVALAPLAALSACAHEVSSAVAHTPDTPGFLLGLWQGFIFPVAWVLSLFVPDIAIYAVPNTGGWYDFGYFLGITVFGVGAHRGTRTVYVRTRRR